MNDGVAERRVQKDAVLQCALQHAAFDGWSRRTLINAAADAGVDPTTARRLFPQGGDSLLDWLDQWTDRRMLAAVAGEDLSLLSVRRRVARILRARFEVLAPHRKSIRRAVVARGLPHNLTPATRSLWRTADLIWEAAGMAESSGEGWSWYTRRASLAGVLASTTFFWLDDASPGHIETWAFLDRRIEDVMRIGRARAQIQDMLRVVPGFRAAARRP